MQCFFANARQQDIVNVSNSALKSKFLLKSLNWVQVPTVNKCLQWLFVFIHVRLSAVVSLHVRMSPFVLVCSFSSKSSIVFALNGKYKTMALTDMFTKQFEQFDARINVYK